MIGIEGVQGRGEWAAVRLGLVMDGALKVDVVRKWL